MTIEGRTKLFSAIPQPTKIHYLMYDLGERAVSPFFRLQFHDDFQFQESAVTMQYENSVLHPRPHLNIFVAG